MIKFDDSLGRMLAISSNEKDFLFCLLRLENSKLLKDLKIKLFSRGVLNKSIEE